MNKNNVKQCLGFIKKMFLGLLSSLANVHKKYFSLKNQHWLTQTTLNYLFSIEYSHGLHYYPIAINSDGHVGRCNTLNDLFVCVSNKTEDLNIHVFKIITGINESKP